MRSFSGIVCLLTLLGGCDDKPKSYNECVLSHNGTGSDRAAVSVSIQTCERMFTRKIPVQLSLTHGHFDSNSKPTRFEMEIENPSRSYLVTKFTVHVVIAKFDDKGIVDDSAIPANSNAYINIAALAEGGKKEINQQVGNVSWDVAFRIDSLSTGHFVGGWGLGAMQTAWFVYSVDVEGVDLR